MYQLLIVDDEYEIRNGLSRYFPWNEAGFQVAGQVGCGKDALAFLRTKPVDLVLCDIMMPGMSGLELAERIRIEFPEVRVCFLTAHKDFSFARRAISLNAVEYILKSASSAELFNTFLAIRQQMDRSRKAASGPVAAEEASSDSAIAPIPPRDSMLISEIQQFIRENYATADLPTVADAIHMSPNYVSKLFKQKTGQTFSDYLMEVKMQKAAELLRNPHYRIYEVGEMVGYRYVKNFSRAFHECFGISPRDFRNGKAPVRKLRIEKL